MKDISCPSSGHAGRDYVNENTRLLRAYKDKKLLEQVVLQANLVMPGLLLQKPHAKAGAKGFGRHLSRRLVPWKEGKIMDLLAKAHTIQPRLLEWD